MYQVCLKDKITMYYVYKLIDPRNNKTFYVGKGKGNRVNDHEKEAVKGNRSKKCALIREIINEGSAIKKKIIRRFANEDDAYAYEESLISKIGLHKLTNQLSGGRFPEFGVGTSDDKIIVRVFVKAAVKTNGFKTGAVYRLCGESFDIPDSLIKKIRNMFFEVYKRRGFNWTKTCMKSMGVTLRTEEKQYAL